MAFIAVNGKIVEKVRARKPHHCHACGRGIDKGENYYKVTIAGGGLGSLKFPERLCRECSVKSVTDVL